MSGGDQAAISWFLAVIVVMCAALVLGMIAAIFEHPWLLICVAGAIFCFVMARREERRTRVQIHTPPSRRGVSR